MNLQYKRGGTWPKKWRPEVKNGDIFSVVTELEIISISVIHTSMFHPEIFVRGQKLTLIFFDGVVEICAITCNLRDFWGMAHALLDFRLLLDQWF